MIKSIKTKFNKKNLLKLFPNSKTRLVSFFHKFEKLNDIKDKKITIVDFEFSLDNQIFEMAFFDVINNQITNFTFKEFQLPLGTKYFNIEQNRVCISDTYFNRNKDILTNEWKQYIIDRMESCDYLVCHNYSAEMQCYWKLKYPGEKYNIDTIQMYHKNKIICTRYSFGKKYFEGQHHIKKFSNGELSLRFNWKVKVSNEEELYFEIFNEEINQYKKIVVPNIKIDRNFTYHNALYDIFITYTNLLSLKYLIASNEEINIIERRK